MRKVWPGSSGEEGVALEMSSLIDVAFLLLIYFVATATLLPKESDLGLTLPGPKGGKGMIETLEIGLLGDGTVTVNDEMVERDVALRQMRELKQRVAMYKAASEMIGAKPVVEFVADDGARGQRFADVLNALTDVGIRDVVLRDW